MIDPLWDSASNELLRETLGPLVPVIETAGHLGDGPVLVIVAMGMYWFGGTENRRKRAFVLGMGVTALAVACTIKGTFQLPRPVIDVASAAAPGYTFPSAHAAGATACYGSLALTMTTGRRWQRSIVAALIIGFIATARVLSGAHFVGDVVLGVAFGVLIVWFGARQLRRRWFQPGPLLLVAGLLAVLSVSLGSREFVALVIGTGIGGAAGWRWIETREGCQRAAAILVTGTPVLVALLGWWGLFGIDQQFLADTTDMWLLALESLGYAVLGAFLVAVPAIATSIEDRPTIRQLQTILPVHQRVFDFDAVR